MGRVASIL